MTSSSATAGRRAPPSWTRAAALLVPGLGFIGLLTFAVVSRADPPAPGDQAPAFSAAKLDGAGSFSLSRARGRPVLLNFWASWCAPCADEAPELERAHRPYGNRVAFVGVDVRDSRTESVAFAKRFGIDYTLVRDDGSIYDAYGLTGQPESFFIDKNGVIVEHVAGPVPGGDLTRLLDVLLARDG